MSEVDKTPEQEEPTQDEIRQLLAPSTRLSDRIPEADKPAEQEEERAPEETRPPRDPSVDWQTYQSIPDQMARAPQTVRPGPSITAVFNLSETSDLAKFNEIQGAATDEVGGRRMLIHDMRKEFFNGSWFVLITYSQIFYQKL